ncbi:aldo/keto reductase [Nocardiopsis sp. L17-MgMaSL7]|uniref:aldo/keto reductase n=1 Tax=Nocardiopsis sp. L17-MgMaSL7 TaxID=1938893 RepID=UPI000D70ADDC|nr:aldo/keto reductase [Nocardiopsis sp. L17-MgMaSL7]PWV44702.1 aryl-alcohol dehydrogenase-like predicted oxidoreductase [Nocardiopsis sp. L17-MgMaSL7]
MTDVHTTPNLARLSGTFALGGNLPVHRLGFGAMQLAGPGAWGEPQDRDEALAVLRRAVELGVTLIDTADSYGPEVNERLIREALHPYPEDLLVTTKVGMVHSGPGQWEANGTPSHLKRQVESSLRNLGLERIGLLQLHWIDPEVPLSEQLGALVELREEGKIHHIGLTGVTREQLRTARRTTPIASVQNEYNPGQRRSEDVLERCEQEGIAFLPWAPIARGELARPDSPLAPMAAERGVTPAQLALAWLLRRSPVMLPIPGTSRVEHLEENMAAASVSLSEAESEHIRRLLAV